jgi:hypothetical protein
MKRPLLARSGAFVPIDDFAHAGVLIDQDFHYLQQRDPDA